MITKPTSVSPVVTDYCDLMEPLRRRALFGITDSPQRERKLALQSERIMGDNRA
jgi:hypothetical protein